jgi:hypothetical protein
MPDLFEKCYSILFGNEKKSHRIVGILSRIQDQSTILSILPDDNNEENDFEEESDSSSDYDLLDDPHCTKEATLISI